MKTENERYDYYLENTPNTVKQFLDKLNELKGLANQLLLLLYVKKANEEFNKFPKNIKDKTTFEVFLMIFLNQAFQ